MKSILCVTFLLATGLSLLYDQAEHLNHSLAQVSNLRFPSMRSLWSSFGDSDLGLQVEKGCRCFALA